MNLYEKHFTQNEIINVSVVYNKKLNKFEYSNPEINVAPSITLNVTNSNQDIAYTTYTEELIAFPSIRSSFSREMVPAHSCFIYEPSVVLANSGGLSLANFCIEEVV